MRIKTQLYIGSLLTLIVAGLFFVILLQTNRAIRAASTKHELAMQVQLVVFQLNTLTHEYLLYRQEREVQQWNAKYIALMALLDEASPSEFVTDIKKNYSVLDDLFVKLIENRNTVRQPAQVDDIDTTLGASSLSEERLIAQFLLKSNDIVSDAARYADQTQKEVVDVNNLVAKVRVNVLYLIGVISVISALSVIRSITKSLSLLSRGANIIGDGNLDYRIHIITPNEVGEVAMAFNDMAQRLQDSYRALEVKSKEVAEEKAKDEAILASIGDAVIACDKDGHIMMMNDAAEVITGYTTKEAIGQHYAQVLAFVKDGDEKMKSDFIAEAMRTRKKTEMTNHTLLVQKNGKKISVADSAASVLDKNGQLLGCVVILRDTTREYEIERAKTEFVSITSHQLRTPLAGIQWLIELLEDEKLSQRERGYVDNIIMSLQRLNVLVELLLSVSRAEEGRVSISPQAIDVVDFTKRIIDSIQAFCNKKAISVHFHVPEQKVVAMTDANALQNIVQNIISNAVEYTPEHGTIDINITMADQMFELSVSDTGIGIPQKDQKDIFKKFTRATNAGKIKAGGTGLGLWIAKQSAELLGGTMWFESVEGKGTTFFAKLPLKAKPSGGARHP